MLAFSAQAQPLSVQLSVVHDACGSGTGEVTATVLGGVPPLTVAWSNGVVSSGDTLILTIEDLLAGMYDVTVTDDLGTVVTDQIELLDLPELQFPWQSATFTTCAGICGQLTYSNLGCQITGVPPYSVNVVPPIGSAAFTPNNCYLHLTGICPGDHTVTISDANGCEKTWTITMEDAQQPQLIDQTVDPACVNGDNGGFTMLFDIPVQINVFPEQTGSNPVIGYGPPEQAVVSGLTEGDFQVYAYNGDAPSCFDTLYVTVPSTNTDCGSISGTLFADLDGDCIMTGADVPLPYRMIDIQPGSQPALTDISGNYVRGAPYGDYSVDHASIGFTVLCPSTTPVDVTLSGLTPDAIVDFAMDPLMGPDAGIFLWCSPLKPGNNGIYLLNVINSGPYTLTDLTVDLTYDPLLTGILSDPTPVIDVPGAVQWSIASLPPFATVQCTLYVAVPSDPGLIGTAMNATAVLSTAPPDADPTNDLYALSTVVTSAFDPNDKRARTSSSSSPDMYFPEIDQYIEFTIRFQNTGNAPAEHVVILDTIAPGLDLMGFVQLGGSHDHTISLLEGRVLRFDHPAIMLPDSASDPLASQGFVRFRIGTTAPQPGDTLKNAADILFDLNPPVRTDTAILVVQGPTLVSAPEEPTIALFPDPVNDLLNVRGLDAAGWTLDLMSADGRMLLHEQGTGTTTRIPVNAFAPGGYLLRIIKAGSMPAVHRFLVVR